MARPPMIVFCERRTGLPRFQVELNGDVGAAVERAASLLAMGCLVRGELPRDYLVWVPADGSLIDQITKQAEEFLYIGRSFCWSVPLSPREGEVLKELLRNRVNKEIADRLGISVRTVKFHVSSLLAKFGVNSRWELIHKAERVLGGTNPEEDLVERLARNHHNFGATEEPKSKQKRKDNDGTSVVPFRRRLVPV